MALTRNFKQTVVERVERDPEFAKALLDEAATLFLSGEPETARLILRDLVNATIGFEQLAAMTDKPSKSLHRMLSPSGNPSMDNLAAIFGAVHTRLSGVRGSYSEDRIGTPMNPIPKIDDDELEILSADEKGQLKSVATKAELAKFKAAARATGIKDRRVNIRLSSGDLSDIQVKALEEGVPYQTLIASVLHKYVTGRLSEQPEPATNRARNPAKRRTTPAS